MQTIENTTTIPAVRRVDEVVAKRDAAAAFLAEKINGLTRAEIGVMRSVLGWGGTDAYTVTSAQYADGYDAEQRWFFGTTRRLSDKALTKALVSLYRAGLIRVEGVAPMGSGDDRYSRSEWNSNRWCHVSPYRCSNSGIRLHDGEVYEWSDESGSGTMTPQQIAGWYGAWLLGLTESDPHNFLYYNDLKCVKIVGAPELVDAMRIVIEYTKIIDSARRVADEVAGLAEIEVAEIVKPDALDIANAVSLAYQKTRRETDDVAAIYSAMQSALSEYRDAALYGSAPRNSMTSEQYVSRVAYLTGEVEKINAKIEEVSR